MKRLLSLLLCAGLLAAPALAAEDAQPQPQTIAPWAYDAMSEAAALGIWEDSMIYCIQDPVTQEQLADMTAVVADKLALLELPVNTGTSDPDALVIDTTRRGVMNALYQEAAAYALEGVDHSVVDFLSGLGVVQGDGADLALERPCTLQEALVMAQRLVLSLYDRYDAGAQGLLWKAEANGNTLYLLGTIHVDRGNIYPFHKSLRDAITASQDAIFEVDFGDVADIQAFQAMQYYSDGTTLKDHVSAEIYDKAVAAGAALPAPYTLDEATVAMFKPWALANLINSIGLMDESSGETPEAIDVYVYSKSMNNGLTVDAVESYVYQGTHIYEGLSEEYQEAYLGAALDTDYTGASTEADDPIATVDAMLDAWKVRDPAAFDAVYGKDAMVEQGDEYTQRLFADRDPGMIAYADTYLKQAGGGHTGFLAVGAGHMVGKTGVVQGLKDLGYTVELVPVG